MDDSTLLPQLWQALQPYLPVLLTEAAKASGQRVPDAVARLWQALAERLRGKPAAQEALEDLRRAPEGPDLQAVLRVQVKKLLAENPAWAAQVAALLRAAGVRYQAELRGDGAIAQGPGATAAGKGAVIIRGDAYGNIIVIGDSNMVTSVSPNAAAAFVWDRWTRGKSAPASSEEGGGCTVHIHGDISVTGDGNTMPTASFDTAALEHAYLSALMEQAGKLSLEGVDPKAAGEVEKRISLSAVYTALLTLSPEAHERMERGNARPREARRRSALQELNDHPHLVLLGDPGSGKSTFVNFVALCLAGERLGHPQANLQTLTAPLPDDGDDQDHPQPWRHGPLLPVRVILRDLAARGLPPVGQPVTLEHLWAFLTAELAHQGLAEYAPLLRRHLREQGGLFLFDGLDEVPAAEARREQIIHLIHQVKAAFPKVRVLVTGHIYAYRKQDWALDGFAAAVLAPFTQGQIIRFVDRWYAHLAQLGEMSPEDAQGRAQLLTQAIRVNPRLRELAERPLLLTLMASLHAWRGGDLPEKREQLYNDTVDLLLDWRERRRITRGPDGTVRLMQPGLAEYLEVGKDRLRRFLNRLAYQAHAGQPEVYGTADIPEEVLVKGLWDLSENPEVNPKRLVEYLRDRAGLLVHRGVGVYTFPHRTFQEYLAACHLTDTGYPEQVAELARQEPDRWREVALLAAAKATRGNAFALWALVEELCPREPGPDPAAEDLWGALLAGQAIVENHEDGAPLSRVNRKKYDRVRDWQVALLHSDLPAVERARAGDTLAALGDPRFDPERYFLPARRWDPTQGRWRPEPTWGFVWAPTGPFRMGSDLRRDPQAYEDEQPQHEVHLDYDYWISRYPVTVAQWRAFVEATGYAKFDERALRAPANRPVRWVTWYDAWTYARWLDGVLRAAAAEQVAQATDGAARAFWEGLVVGRLRVALPSEAEWEKAARGTDGRIYPWGDDFDPERANTEETRLGDTSAVGAFPRGASPYGALDLSGNIWEWTRGLWGKEREQPEYNYRYNPMDGREDLRAPADVLRVLRGGSFNDPHWFARAAIRARLKPDSKFRFSTATDEGFRLVVIPGSVLGEQGAASGER